MGLSGSTVFLKTTNCLRQLYASSVVVYQLLELVTLPPLRQSPDTSSKSDSPLKIQYQRP